MAPAASQETKSLFRAISHASTTWWCYGRFWIQQVDNHPAFGVAIRGLCNAPAFLNAPSSQLTAALNRHAEVLFLKITRVTSQALWVQAKRCRAALGIPLQDSECFFEESLEINTQNTDQDSSIRHALRLRARRILLHQVSRNRFDSEGIENIDLPCTSRQAWSKWVKSLCPADTTALCVWKSGAIWTPTRRFHRPRAPQSERTVCPWCQHPQASARHFFVECEHFKKTREALQTQHNIHASWWGTQPRCTTKSAWISYQAARTEAQRVQCAIAAGKLGIAIFSATSAVKD